MRKMLTLPLLCLPGLALACPEPPDHEAEKAELLAAVKQAPNELAARVLTDRLWEIWADAPDETAQDLLDRGMRQRADTDYAVSKRTFDALTAYCPDYAEGYNQRAFVLFLQRDFDAALADLDRALAITPDHIAALAGKALTLIGLGRDAEGQALLRQALEMNPWLSERRFLVDGTPDGEDI